MKKTLTLILAILSMVVSLVFTSANAETVKLWLPDLFETMGGAESIKIDNEAPSFFEFGQNEAEKYVEVEINKLPTYYYYVRSGEMSAACFPSEGEQQFAVIMLENPQVLRQLRWHYINEEGNKTSENYISISQNLDLSLSVIETLFSQKDYCELQIAFRNEEGEELVAVFEISDEGFDLGIVTPLSILGVYVAVDKGREPDYSNQVEAGGFTPQVKVVILNADIYEQYKAGELDPFEGVSVE